MSRISENSNPVVIFGSRGKKYYYMILGYYIGNIVIFGDIQGKNITTGLLYLGGAVLSQKHEFQMFFSSTENIVISKDSNRGAPAAGVPPRAGTVQL